MENKEFIVLGVVMSGVNNYKIQDYIYIIYFSELKGYHFPGIKTCYYTTLELTLEMTRDLWSWT